MLTGLPDLNLKSTQLKQNVYEYSFNYILKRKIQDNVPNQFLNKAVKNTVMS